jgi:SAM-dependent methyltransferase
MDNRRLESIARLSSLAARHDLVLEIGCGLGKTLDIAEQYFNRSVGIEPSKRHYSLIEKKSNRLIINEYFHNDLSFGDKFDAFYALQVFEHLEKPIEVLKNIFNVLKPGGVGLIEVPDGAIMMNNHKFMDLFLMHLNYYTPYSISTLAHLAGFNILNINSVTLENRSTNIELFVQKPVEQKPISHIMAIFDSQIIGATNGHLNIVIWGAGLMSYWTLEHLMKKLSITHIVDSDAKKHGLYMSCYSVPIEYPTEAIFAKADLVIIFAGLSKESIIKSLHNDYHYTGEILDVEAIIGCGASRLFHCL